MQTLHDSFQNKILITGPPGCGKTTLIKNLYHKLKHLNPAGFYTEEIRIPAFDEQKDLIIKKLKERLKDYTLITLDGVKVQFSSGSILIRKSNTEPVIKIVIEGSSKPVFEEIRKFYEDVIRKEIEGIQSA